MNNEPDGVYSGVRGIISKEAQGNGPREMAGFDLIDTA